MTFPIAGSYGRCSVNAVSEYDLGVDAKSSNDKRSSMVASLEVRRKKLDGNAALGRTLVRQRVFIHTLLYAICIIKRCPLKLPLSAIFRYISLHFALTALSLYTTLAHTDSAHIAYSVLTRDVYFVFSVHALER